MDQKHHLQNRFLIYSSFQGRNNLGPTLLIWGQDSARVLDRSGKVNGKCCIEGNGRERCWR